MHQRREYSTGGRDARNIVSVVCATRTAMESVRTNVFCLRGKIHAWNVNASSSDVRAYVSWIKQWENATGLARGRCSFDDCTQRAEVGGHVWIKKNGVFIAPICKSCNYYANADRMQSIDGCHSFLRRGTVVFKTEMTDDMRNAERWFAVSHESRRRRCMDCDGDISDRPDTHLRCLICYRTAMRSR